MNQSSRLKKLAELMDSKFKGPFGIEFGLDSVIGLIPIWGDAFTRLISGYILIKGAYRGYPLPILVKMVINIIIEWTLESIPILGNIMDLFWKTNKKNIELMKAYDENPAVLKKNKNSLIFLTVTVFSLFILLFILFLYLSFKLFTYIF